MKFKKLTASIIAAVMAVTAVGTPIVDELPLFPDNSGVVASADAISNYVIDVEETLSIICKPDTCTAKVKSSDTSVVAVSDISFSLNDGWEGLFYIKGIAEGTAKITVYGIFDEKIYAEYFIKVQHKYDDGIIVSIATCKDDEIIRYTCKNCAYTKEVNLGKDESNHVGEKILINAKEPSCGDGYTGDFVCSACNYVYSKGKIVPAIYENHTEVKDEQIEPTCENVGYTEGSHCSVCGTVINKQEIIAAKGHSAVIDKAVAATKTTTGLTEGSHCSVCGKTIVGQEIIPTLNPELSHGIISNSMTVNDTRVINGDFYVKEGATLNNSGQITVNGNVYIFGTIKNNGTLVVNGTINALNYNNFLSAGNYSYGYLYNNGTLTANRLNVTSSYINVHVPTLVHSYGSWVIEDNPTCSKEGSKSRICSVCGIKETATIAKLTLPKVTGVKLTGRAADALRINWTKNTSADGYIVEMYQGNKWVRVAKITNNSTTTFRKAGLKASSVYKFRVRAYKMSGSTALYGNYSATVAARTNPSVMTGAKLGGRAADALRINWAKNASADGYIVEMYQGNKWVRVGKITKNSTTTFRKSGLKASTAYKFRVRAYKMSGKTALYGAYSSTVSARTNPSAVKGVKIAGKATNALRLSWTKNTSAQGYIVEMYKGGKWVRVAKITNGNTTTYRKSRLAKNTTYKFRVKAYYMSGKTALYGGYGSVSGKTAAK